MKRWLVVLIVALILGTLGVTLHQIYLDLTGILLIIFAVAAFIWSWVRLSYEIRPRRRRRSRRAAPQLEGADGVRRSRTAALHAIIFRSTHTDVE
jgi:protein-S-isoprenylcysteine O-methyltransferase Ste14